MAEHFEVTEEEQALAATIRENVFALVRIHEERAHDGQPCMENRAGFLAWMAHSVGFCMDNLDVFVEDFAEALQTYDAEHASREATNGHRHRHDGEGDS